MGPDFVNSSHEFIVVPRYAQNIVHTIGIIIGIIIKKNPTTNGKIKLSIILFKV